ncbi:putative zinc-binding metallopeptidase [soil metagenome]
MTDPTDWQEERERLLGQRISDLGLSVSGTSVEKLTQQLYAELEAAGLRFRPPVYLSDEWGCPEGTPLIGVPFYLASPHLSRIEEDFALGIEDESDIIRFLRHEAGHAFNYAYRLHERTDWHETFGSYSRPYRERYAADPFSRDHVRHILAWYAQKHPDEDFAETFAVWLTPGSGWRESYRGWGALAKLEYVDSVMGQIGSELPPVPEPSDDDVPVESMRYTVARHYEDMDEVLPVEDESVFDSDLRMLFPETARPDELGPGAPTAAAFIRQHRRELVGRITYWTGESASLVRRFVDSLAGRAETLNLRAWGREASTLIELTAFGTAVMMNYRYSSGIPRKRRTRQ